MLKLMAEKATLNVVNDQQGSPTYAADIADLVMQMIFSQRWQPGIYHYCNSGVISWYDFAIAIKELTGSPCSINPIPTSAYPTKAKRPAYSALNCDKLQKEYDIKLKEWKQSLDKCLSRLDIQSGIN
jgi:dTDP-4-dehydrorhamnose reductase